jgi:hypothetical protein
MKVIPVQSGINEILSQMTRLTGLAAPVAGYNAVVINMKIITLSCAIVLLTVLAGCAGAESGLKHRAAQYYSYMVGLSPGTQYSSFFSPAYRKTFKKATLKKLNAEMSMSEEANTRYKPVQAKHISVLIEGRFAYSSVSSELGQAYGSVGPVRWVRVGSRWYLYSSSGAEASAYGSFPSGIAPPAPPTAAAPVSLNR